jgi:hypothetical protein
MRSPDCLPIIIIANPESEETLPTTPLLKEGI